MAKTFAFYKFQKCVFSYMNHCDIYRELFNSMNTDIFGI